MKAMPGPAIAPQALERDLLRFLTCGSVDDGKSTLIGRLLFDSKLILEDQLASLSADSRKFGTTGEEIDLALLLDGLEAEREQGITIDVAYRFFTTPNRSFIVADAPGHEQYTRNMATGASACDLAVILVDARNGVRTQTRRHSYICSLLGIRHVVLAVNKMDLVDYSRDVFERIAGDYATFAADLGFRTLAPIPISARHGDNVTRHHGNLPWYHGPTVIEHLETVDVATDLAARPFRFAVQWVNRPNADFRGFAGVVASGVARPGDPVLVNGTGRTARIGVIHTADGERAEALPGDAVTLTLNEEIDIARGDLLAGPETPPQIADQLAAHILWMSEEPLLPGRSYRMRIGNRWVTATVTALKHRVDVNTLDHIAARNLGLNEIAFCNLSTSAPVTFDAYDENRDTGSFILVDRFTNETCAAGLIRFALRRATNVRRETLSVSKAERAALKQQKPAIVWFTGLSGSGKSTIARLVEKHLFDQEMHTYMLDGDNVRLGLNRDLGFTDADRVENIRRIGEVAKLLVDSGLLVLCSFISPFRAERQMVRSLVEESEFIEVFVDTPLEECIRRDPKGLYARAQAGEIKNFTGIDSPYERPENAQIIIATTEISAEEAAEQVVAYLARHRNGGD